MRQISLPIACLLMLVAAASFAQSTPATPPATTTTTTTTTTTAPTTTQQQPYEYDPPVPLPYAYEMPWYSYLFAYGFVFQIAAVVHWARRRPGSYWLWIIIIGGFIGAFAYLIVEVLPDLQRIKIAFAGPSRRKRIRMLRAIVIDNPAAGNYEELGELLMLEKKWGDARDAYDRALSSRTDSIDPFYRRAICSFELADYPTALRDLERVIAFDQKYDYSHAYCLYAQSLSKSGNREAALEAFERLSQSSTAAESLYYAASFFAEIGRGAEAREIVQRVIARQITMPAYQKRRDRNWLRKSKALERKLRNAQERPSAVAAA